MDELGRVREPVHGAGARGARTRAGLIADRIASAGSDVFFHYLRLRSCSGQDFRGSWCDNLLRATLLSGDEARQAWERIRPTFDIDRLMPETVRLLPLLYQNLEAIQLDDPLIPRLRGLYRQTWYRNQILFRDLQAALRRFHSAGVEALVVRGIAIGLRYYGDLGLRPMNAFDLLVHPVNIADAIRLLDELGWAPLVSAPAVSGQHSRRFRNSRSSCRLHWAIPVLGQHDRSGDLTRSWSRARSFAAGEIALRTLASHDELVWVCQRGTQGGWRPRIQWVADAAMILRSSDLQPDPSVPWLPTSVRMKAAKRFLEATAGLVFPAP